MVDAFGADDSGGGLYASGPDRDLLGQPAGRTRVIRGLAGRVDLDSTELLAGFNRGAPTVPSFVTGRLNGDAAGRARGWRCP